MGDRNVLIGLLLLFAIEVLFVVVMISPASITNQIKTDLRTAERWLGHRRAIELEEQMNRFYREWFVDTGIVAESYDLLTLTEDEKNNKNAGIRRLGESSFFAIAEERLNSFWMMVRAMCLRYQLFAICFLHALPLVIPAIVDGLVRRDLLKRTPENASITTYEVARRGLLITMIGPLLYCHLPIGLNPYAIGIWALILTICAWTVASNMQQRI